MSKKIEQGRRGRWPAIHLVWTAIAMLFASGFTAIARAGSPESLPLHELPAAVSIPLAHDRAPFRRAAPSPYPAPGVQPVRYTAFAPATGVRTRTALAELIGGVAGEPPRWRNVKIPQGMQRQLLFHPGQSSYWGPLPGQPPQPLFVGSREDGESLVDQWASLFTTGFEEPWPASACLAPGHSWSAVGGQAAAGFFAARPMLPALGPTGLSEPRWLVCGPFRMAPDDRLLVEYTYRLAMLPGALLFFGISYDGPYLSRR